MAESSQTTSPEAIREALLSAPGRRRPIWLQYVLYYLGHKPLGTIGFLIVVSMVLIAIFAPLIAPYAYQEQNYEAIRQAPAWTSFSGLTSWAGISSPG